MPEPKTREQIAEELHEYAMALADQAALDYRQRRFGDAAKHWGEAAEKEELAGDVCRVQPSKSILYRSATWLAIEARQYERAEEIGKKGIRSDCPVEILGDITEARMFAEARLKEVRKANEGMRPKRGDECGDGTCGDGSSSTC